MNKTSNRQLLDRKYKLSTLRTKLCLAIALMSLLATAQSTKTKLACVGNSITYGYTLANPSTQSYPSQLQAMLGTTNWTVGNYGVSARTMLKKGDRPYWNETAYTNALNSQPNIVMIELGTNDAKTTNWIPYGSQFVTDYKAMIQSFRNLNSKPEIWRSRPDFRICLPSGNFL